MLSTTNDDNESKNSVTASFEQNTIHATNFCTRVIRLVYLPVTYDERCRVLVQLVCFTLNYTIENGNNTSHDTS